MPGTFVLNTSRLSLHEVTYDDLDFILSLRSDPETMRFYPKTLNREECVQWIDRMRTSYENHGHGHWLVCDRITGEPRGQTGVLRQDVSGRELIEVGYIMHRSFWRQGLATEAAIACRDWAFQNLDLDRVHSLIRPDNVPSQGVARKMGMIPEPEPVPFCELEHLVFGIDRPAWDQSRSSESQSRPS